MASALGVGLIEMIGPPTRLRITELLAAPAGQPIERLKLEVIEKLGYSTCTVCRSLFKRGEGKRFRGNVKTKVADAIENDKGLMYWLHEVAKRQPPSARTSRTSWTDTDMTFNRRYVCPDCVVGLFGNAT